MGFVPMTLSTVKVMTSGTRYAVTVETAVAATPSASQRQSPRNSLASSFYGSRAVFFVLTVLSAVSVP